MSFDEFRVRYGLYLARLSQIQEAELAVRKAERTKRELLAAHVETTISDFPHYDALHSAYTLTCGAVTDGRLRQLEAVADMLQIAPRPCAYHDDVVSGCLGCNPFGFAV